MDIYHAIWLALLQGLTEFLPISSSGHLILLPRFMNWPDQGLAFDVAVHVGTLAAVLIYFRQDLLVLTRAWFGSLHTRKLDQHSRLAWGVLLATIPVGLAGYLMSGMVSTALRDPMVIAATTIIFGVLLGAADRLGKRSRDEHSLGFKDVMLIGLAQAVALVPGTSRSGITMTAGLLLGLTREAAERFSFLLSIPVIVLAGGLEGLDLLESANAVDWGAMLVGVSTSAIGAYLCIHFFLKLIGQVGMWPFVLYRLFLGAVILVAFH
ncbi:MAG: undecaprenyl-diphosphate phosphatase [Gammaproteobacteria bacterium]|nr:undecaprenyl-diphosphate phosphatase [Gammaproteobacteria bacterium]